MMRRVTKRLTNGSRQERDDYDDDRMRAIEGGRGELGGF